VKAVLKNGMISTIKLENKMNMSHNSKQLMISLVLVFFMLLTRGSHVLTQVALPDASLALLLIGGLLLRKTTWFVLFVVLATVIDFAAAAVDSLQAFCLTAGYWGMLPTYAVMWIAGVWLGKQTEPFNALKFAVVSAMATLLAFVFSTQTYYLFSGRFPVEGVIESLKHGWHYLPSYMGFTAIYLISFWLMAKAIPALNLRQLVKIA
jgi:hypothetical protein